MKKIISIALCAVLIFIWMPVDTVFGGAIEKEKRIVNGTEYWVYFVSLKVDTREGIKIPVEDSMTDTDMDTMAEGVIKADNRDSEKFEVTDGIPVTEDLYTNVFCKEYLFHYLFTKIPGEKFYTIEVTKEYNLSWQENHPKTVPTADGGTTTVDNWETETDTETVTQSYEIRRVFAYWIIDELDVFGIDSATIENDALPSRDITMYPDGYSPPDVDYDHSDSEADHITEPEYEDVDLGSESLNGGKSGRPSVPSEDWTDEAEDAIGKILVRNDRLDFNGSTLMSDEEVEEEGPQPSPIERGGIIDRDVLYERGMTIPITRENEHYPTYGNVEYTSVADVNSAYGSSYDEDISNLEEVVVHTPVVCYTDMKDDRDFNQELTPDNSRKSLILDRPSFLEMPTSGQHRSIKGYGNRDYEKYTKIKQVRFPFDIFIDSPTEYIKANTWYTVPVSQTVMNFYVPSWVDEGNYQVDYRQEAININSSFTNSTENLANKGLYNYVATKTIDVRVIGRLYGFTVTDIKDYPTWEEVFRSGKNTAKHSDKYYKVGLQDENTKPIPGAQPLYTIPILQGSHPRIKNKGATRTGYGFTYRLQTMGNYFNDNDYVRIKPTFYYINYDGTNKQEVDIWYNEEFEDKQNHFIKIGSEKDKLNKKYIKLGNPYRNVPNKDITITSYITNILEKDFRNTKISIGTLAKLVLPIGIRTFVETPYDIYLTTNLENYTKSEQPNNVSSFEIGHSLDSNRVVKSVQDWYGEYYIPDQAFVAPKDYDVIEYARINNGLNGKEAFWLKKGYIIVNFDIETIKDGDFTNPVLSYGKANCNMWSKEGYDINKVDSNGITYIHQYGDIIFYYANKSASGNYKIGGTH